MTMTVPFVPASSFTTARRYADVEIRNDITPNELVWLREHPLLWMRALIVMQREAENHIAKDRMDMNEHKPVNGEHDKATQAAWMRLKGQLDQRTKARLHFIQKVKARKDEVKALIGSDSAVDRMLVGDVIGDILEIAELARMGDLRAVQSKAYFDADKWAERYGDAAQP
jgi:hypothetical protein